VEPGALGSFNAEVRSAFPAIVFSLAFVGSAHAQTTLLLGSDSNLTGWTATTRGVSILSDIDNFDINGTPYSLAPAIGFSMFKISPDGNINSGSTDLESELGLAVGAISSLLETNVESFGSITNFGYVTKSFELSPGTYRFSWAVAATDYQPYNDGVLFAIVGAGSEQVISLARNGSSELDTSGPSPNTLVLGSFGSTSWKTTEFNLVNGGTYQVSFVAYNWNDSFADSVLYVSAISGSFSGTEVEFSSPSAIPEPSTYALIGGVAALGLAWLRRGRRQKIA
jgi:hypothetical protein